MGKNWDVGLDFERVRALLGEAFEAEKAGGDGHRQPRLVYLATALIQVVNGARASEAWDALLLWLANKQVTQTVRARKRGKVLACQLCRQKWTTHSIEGGEEALFHARTTGHPVEEELVVEPRRMVIPEEIEGASDAVKAKLTSKTTLGAYKQFCIQKLGFNSHSLRFAQISWQGRQRIPAQVGRLITKHAKLEQFAHYQNQAEADRILDALRKKPALPVEKQIDGEPQKDKNENPPEEEPVEK